MKLVTYTTNGQEALGVWLPQGILNLKLLEIPYESMNELIGSITEEELERIRQASPSEAQLETIEQVKLCAPIPRPKQDLICLGINYLAHAEESARFKKQEFERNRDYPVYFSKRVNEAVADGEGIQAHTDIVENLDYEAELAVIIRKDAKNVSSKEALDYIFGYTIVNDVSARTIQTRHKQWYFGKSLDGFTPMGPCIVTADEFEGVPDLKITSKVNGELRQNSMTGLQMFDITYVIEELSRGMTLKAGTIISTGTPAGVGMGFQPPKFLNPGDVVECAIEGIGTLTNPVVE